MVWHALGSSFTEGVIRKKEKKIVFAHPGNRTLVSTVGGYYDTTTPDALSCCLFFLYCRGIGLFTLFRHAKKKEKEMEKWGIDPHTSRMLSERSTI